MTSRKLKRKLPPLIISNPLLGQEEPMQKYARNEPYKKYIGLQYYEGGRFGPGYQAMISEGPKHLSRKELMRFQNESTSYPRGPLYEEAELLEEEVEIPEGVGPPPEEILEVITEKEAKKIPTNKPYITGVQKNAWDQYRRKLLMGRERTFTDDKFQLEIIKFGDVAPGIYVRPMKYEREKPDRTTYEEDYLNLATLFVINGSKEEGNIYCEQSKLFNKLYSRKRYETDMPSSSRRYVTWSEKNADADYLTQRKFEQLDISDSSRSSSRIKPPYKRRDVICSPTRPHRNVILRYENLTIQRTQEPDELIVIHNENQYGSSLINDTEERAQEIIYEYFAHWTPYALFETEQDITDAINLEKMKAIKIGNPIKLVNKMYKRSKMYSLLLMDNDGRV
jgi:hypothetical protein